MHPLHDLYWSFQQGMLHETFFKDSLTTATWGLVVVTLLLVFDSWNKGREQQDRWNREDKQRAELQSPQFEFGLEVHVRSIHSGDKGLFLWCANLGSVSFIVNWMQVIPFTTSGPKLTDGYLEPNVLVSVGEKVEIPVPSSFYELALNRPLLHINMEATIRAKSSSVLKGSEMKVFSLLALSEGKLDSVRTGLHQIELIPCSKCDFVGSYDPEGQTSVAKVTAAVEQARRDITNSCPNHGRSYN